MGFRWGDSSLVIAIFYARIRFAVLRTTALYKQKRNVVDTTSQSASHCELLEQLCGGVNFPHLLSFANSRAYNTSGGEKVDNRSS